MLDGPILTPADRGGKRQSAANRAGQRRPVHAPREILAECRARGIDPAYVAMVKAHLHENQEAGPLRRREMRQLAWQKMKYGVPGCWPFWRHGFRAHYGKRYDAHDYQVIPCWDELFVEMAAEFPEWTDRIDDFFAELFSDCPRLKTAAELWSEALGQVLTALDRGNLATGGESGRSPAPDDTEHYDF